LRCQVCFLLMVWLFSICIVPMAGAVSERHFLEVIDLSSNATILSLPLFLDETFTIRYIHSVDHSPVCEVFELDQEGRLTLQATYFKMFGAGMGHWQGRGYIDFDGQWTWIRNIHETLGSFILRVGSPSVDHLLLYRGQEIPLSRKWAGKRLYVTVVRGSSGADTPKNYDSGVK
jgi:hypothetical protein